MMDIFEWANALAEREAGMKQAADHAEDVSPGWQDAAYQWVRKYAKINHRFISDLMAMGPRSSPKHSVDRIDVNGNYEPSNCRWATKLTQARNTRSNTINAEIAATIRTLAAEGIPKIEISRQLGVHYSTVKQVALGKQWMPEKAVA